MLFSEIFRDPIRYEARTAPSSFELYLRELANFFLNGNNVICRKVFEVVPLELHQNGYELA